MTDRPRDVEVEKLRALGTELMVKRNELQDALANTALERDKARAEAEKLASDVKLMMPAVEKSERYREALESVIEILDHDLLMLRRVHECHAIDVRELRPVAERDEARAAARAATEDMADWRDHADRYREALEAVDVLLHGQMGLGGKDELNRLRLMVMEAAAYTHAALGGGDD